MRHPFARWIARRALRWFYRETHLVGTERIPADGPVLLVGNHPNDLPDVLFGLLATPRPVRYVATAAAATSVLVRWAYEGMRVIPVTRVKDARKLRQRGADMAASNRVAFERVTDALASGDLVGVFPEGGVFDGPGIGPIRSGVARLALESCMCGGVQDIVVVPIGVQYESPSEPGSDAVAVVGEPLRLSHWLRDAPERPYHAFTVELRRMLESVSRTAITAADVVQRNRLLAATGGAVAQGGTAPIVSALALHSVWPSFQQMPHVTDAVDAICGAVTRAGGRATSARDCARLMEAADGTVIPRSAGLFLRAPFALVAGLLHAPAFRGIWALSRRVSAGPSDRAARAIVPGFYLIFAWYAVLGALLASGLAWAGWSPYAVVPTVLLCIIALPRIGDSAVAWYHEWSAYRFARRVQRWSTSDRARVRESMHTLRSAWASHIPGPEVSILA